MLQTQKPDAVRLIMGILGADQACLSSAVTAVQKSFGQADLTSPVWSFTQTDYYRLQAGDSILRQFLSFEKLIDPGNLAEIKHQTNALEQQLAADLALPLPRPVNLDPGIIEPSKLVLASTKNFAHRIYIGQNMYAEVTLIFRKGDWQSLEYTFPDYRQNHYHDFFTAVRNRLIEQLRAKKR
ncbi:MAG: DUF4416 family protein [Planctomycetota bacterium]|nr:DUF4416 family protein [Planctomycetota bacterium]